MPPASLQSFFVTPAAFHRKYFQAMHFPNNVVKFRISPCPQAHDFHYLALLSHAPSRNAGSWRQLFISTSGLGDDIHIYTLPSLSVALSPPVLHEIIFYSRLGPSAGFFHSSGRIYNYLSLCSNVYMIRSSITVRIFATACRKPSTQIHCSRFTIDCSDVQSNPCARSHLFMFTHSSLEETTKRIQELCAKKSQLLQEVDKVEQELGEVQAHHGRLLNECAAISKLPHELLASIFHQCQDMWLTTNSKQLFEVVASHVSSHWRETALGTSLLWNNIHLHITPRNNGEHHAQQLMAYLTRSGNCPLDISLRIIVPENIPRFLGLLVPHADRWRRISVFLTRCSVNDVYAPLCDVAAPALIHLSLRVGNPKDDPHSPRTEYPCISPPILKGGSPCLSFVRVAGMVVGSMEPPLSAVTTLHIDAWPRNLMNQSRFQAMFESLPCLINLSLTGLNIYLPRDPLHVTIPTPMPSLRSLRIRGKSTPCHRFLSLMEVPHLESLSLHGVDTFDSAPLPTLRSLTLDSCVLSENDIRNILRAFPSVSTFSVDHSVPQTFLMHSMVTEAMWPYLEVISLRQLQPDDAASFCLLSMSRSGDRGRLRGVRIDKRSRKVLKAKGYLQNLRDVMPVANCENIDSWPPNLGYEDSDDDWDY